MPDYQDAVTRPSTTWEWRLCKIRSSHLEGTARSSAQIARDNRRRKSVRKGSVQVQIVYRGGAEDAWLVRLDGGNWRRVPGWLCITDALTALERSW